MAAPAQESLIKLYAETFGSEPTEFHVLRADGSNRELYRLVGSDGTGIIGVHGPDAAENRAFLRYSRDLRGAGLPVPEIFAQNMERHIYLEEDLGDLTLYGALCAAREAAGPDAGFPESMMEPYRKVVRMLPRFQVEGGKALDFSVAYPRAEFDRRSILWDLHYFKYLFLKLTGVSFEEEHLEDDFERLTDRLLTADIEHFLYRDFQSRNIMLRGDSPATAEPWFIDYQGGRRGALQYDVASLLYDAKADLPESVRSELLGEYLTALGELIAFDREEFVRLFPAFALVRALQALGAYGYRGLYERKEHFISSIPYGIRNVLRLLDEELGIDLPELTEVFEDLHEQFADDDQFPAPAHSARQVEAETAVPANGTDGAAEESGLTVHITSFSYKRGGYPTDDSEHGGGFIFDCRSLFNPGRYPEYADLTGCDRAVIDVLEQDDSVEGFWENVRSVLDAAIGTYVRRGFDYLSVGFGCTGGQHRSVYFAERLAAHLKEAHPNVSVRLGHREQPHLNERT